MSRAPEALPRRGARATPQRAGWRAAVRVGLAALSGATVVGCAWRHVEVQEVEVGRRTVVHRGAVHGEDRRVSVEVAGDDVLVSVLRQGRCVERREVTVRRERRRVERVPDGMRAFDWTLLAVGSLVTLGFAQECEDVQCYVITSLPAGVPAVGVILDAAPDTRHSQVTEVVEPIDAVDTVCGVEAGAAGVSIAWRGVGGQRATAVTDGAGHGRLPGVLLGGPGDVLVDGRPVRRVGPEGARP